MAFPPKPNALTRAAANPMTPPMPMKPSMGPPPIGLPDVAQPGDMQDPAGQGQGNDAQIIMAAAANDPVIAAIARVLGIG